MGLKVVLLIHNFLVLKIQKCPHWISRSSVQDISQKKFWPNLISIKKNAHNVFLILENTITIGKAGDKVEFNYTKGIRSGPATYTFVDGSKEVVKI